MLKHVRLKNFVRFEEEQKLDFEKGCHFFIGPNNSGKSCVFEAIRRCMSISTNTSLSSSYEWDKTSVVICIYAGIHDNNIDDKNQDIQTKIKHVGVQCIIEAEPHARKDDGLGWQEKIDSPGYESTEETEDQAMSADFKNLDTQKKMESCTEEDDVIEECSNSNSQVEEKYQQVEGKMLTSIICLPKKEKDDSSVHVKTVIFFGKNACQFGMEFIKENRYKVLVNERINFLVNRKMYEFLVNLLETIDSDNCIEEFVEHVLYEHWKALLEKSETFATKDIRADEEVPCNRILRDYLDKEVVVTFSMRSIGPLQWSLSERVNIKYKDENYREARKRSEIITWYISEYKKNMKTPGIVEKEQLYFERITNNSDFKFTQNNVSGEIEVYKKKDLIPILKVPEGIIEAKTCSILLAVDCFKTVGLEDPERGMHPQMIERLRDLVLWEMKNENKVILLTTHHQSFLAPWAISRMFFFRHGGRTTTSRIISGKLITNPFSDGNVTNHEKPDKTIIPHTLRIITGYPFSSLFFAERILFVEGKGDYLFMSAVRKLFLENEYFVVKKEVNKLEKFRRFVASLQIMELGGEGGKEKINKLCKTLEIERYLLLDNDSIRPKVNEKATFVQNFDLEREFKQEDIEKNAHLLEKVGIFVWKQKDIEKVFETFCKEHKDTHKRGECNLEHDDITECLTKNKVPINQRKWKLFKDTSITNEHIENVVGLFLVISEVETESEIRRLVNFLYKNAIEMEGDMISTPLSTY